MYKVNMQSKSGSELFATVSGHPSDWVTENKPEPEAVLETLASAILLANIVVINGYAQPKVVAA
jgi:hypothetical protein